MRVPKVFPAASATSSIAMQTEEGALEPPYSGPFYVASIEPPLDGAGDPLTFATKIGAWGKCLEWCAEHRLPLRNYCNGKVGSRSSEEKSL